MKRLRVVSYAINGRGVGHLVRQLAILRWVRFITQMLGVQCECWVLTSSEADTLARREGFPALKMPSKAMMRDAGIEPARMLAITRTWVMNAISGLRPDLLLVDTFPGGSYGELVAALELAPRRVLVARRVRAEFAEGDSYGALLPLYDEHIVPDERGVGPILLRERCELLERSAAREALGIEGDRRAVYVTLGGGGDPAAARALPALVDDLLGRGWHVVVGAGPLYSGRERRGAGITWLDRYVPVELLTGVDAAVSAAGYNAFNELMYVGVPTVFLPQPRIADDQEERARGAERAGAGRVAATIGEVAEQLEAPGDAARARALVPENGARAAAALALRTLIPEDDLAAAAASLTPGVLGGLRQLSGDTGYSGTAGQGDAFELMRVLAGGSPAERRRRRAVLAELAERGHELPEVPDEATRDPGPRLARFLGVVRDCAAPLSTARALVHALQRKFPAATGDELIAAAETLFPVWARFDDWMGAVALLRAVPTQRAYEIGRFAADLAAWLAHEGDLFDALRSLSHLQEDGESTVADALRRLAARHEKAVEEGEQVHGL